MVYSETSQKSKMKLFAKKEFFTGRVFRWYRGNSISFEVEVEMLTKIINVFFIKNVFKDGCYICSMALKNKINPGFFMFSYFRKCFSQQAT